MAMEIARPSVPKESVASDANVRLLHFAHGRGSIWPDAIDDDRLQAARRAVGESGKRTARHFTHQLDPNPAAEEVRHFSCPLGYQAHDEISRFLWCDLGCDPVVDLNRGEALAGCLHDVEAESEIVIETLRP